MRLAAALSLPLLVAAGDPEGPVVPVPQACTSANTSSLPFCNPKLSTEKRVARSDWAQDGARRNRLATPRGDNDSVAALI